MSLVIDTPLQLSSVWFGLRGAAQLVIELDAADVVE
ncbi:MAG: hypothetical protein QOI28_4374 [Mycobacterium sp.]|nr:hypothetical protein [Mycobacterium sp.]MDT5198492.1 hypothetical protein [Mycobacterium sp.]MDT5290591.1 hypothetical protein [Mycobacterium sp.]